MFIFKTHDLRFNFLLVCRSLKVPAIATLLHCVPFLKYLGRKPMRNLNVFLLGDCLLEAGLAWGVGVSEGEHSKLRAWPRPLRLHLQRLSSRLVL